MSTLIYVQETGAFLNGGSPTLDVIYANAYAGAGRHKNNPDSQCISDLGPIPTGVYEMGPIRDEGPLKMAIRLTPDSDNEMCGRSGFLIHGESAGAPGWASAGCIIVPDRQIRHRLSESFDSLKVVARVARVSPPRARLFNESAPPDDAVADTGVSDDMPDRARIPRFLGRGYWPHLSQVSAQVVDETSRNALDPTGLQGQSATVAFGLLANEEHFESAMSVDAEVKTSYAGFGGEAKMSLRENVTRDLSHVTFAVSMQVIRGALSLNHITPSDIAKQALAKPMDFLRVYGTDVIDTVVLGGACVFFFTFKFNSASEAKSFAGSMDMSYGENSGSVSASLRTLLTKRSADLKVSGYVTGTTELPDFFTTAFNRNADGTKAIFTEAFSQTVLEGILKYVDAFPSIIRRARLLALSQVGLNSVPFDKTEISLAAGFEDAATIIGQAREIGSKLNQQHTHAKRIAHQLSVMLELFPAYNSTRNLTLADQMLESVQIVSRKVEDRMNALYSANLSEDFDFAAEFPVIPSSFCTREPVFHEWSFEVPVNGVIYAYDLPILDSNATHTVSAIASFYHVSYRTGSGTGMIALHATDKETKPTELGKPPTFNAEVRKSFDPLPEENRVGILRALRVGRKQGNVLLSVGPWSFVPAEDGGARVLIQFAEDIQGHTLHVKVAVGRQ
jgi:hypothetical protein